MSTDGFAHHGVFTHEHDCLSAQRQTDGLHLLGANVVGADDETFWVVVQKLLQKKVHYNLRGTNFRYTHTVKLPVSTQ